MARIITYECEQCGTEVVVTEGRGAELRPIYCCGIEVIEISPVQNKAVAKKPTKKIAGKIPTKPVKKLAKKEEKKVVAKKVVKKKVAVKKTTAAKNKKAKK